MRHRVLTYEEARSYYDGYGAKQDSQAYYEDRAFEKLCAFANFENASSVLEVGVGTGRHAANLLKTQLPDDCRYTAIDISPTMTEIATSRLSPWKDRLTVRCTDGSMRFPEPDETFDRVVSNYVLDLLSKEDIQTFVSEAHRLLSDRGLLCLTSLTYGRGPVTGAVSAIWNAVHRIDPKRVGGCRPMSLLKYLSSSGWDVQHRSLITRRAISSEVIVAATTRGARPSGAVS